MPPVHHPITPVAVFAAGTPVMKLIVVILIVATVAALVVLAGKLRGARRLNGGSAYLSGLRLGGPILGALGASWSLLSMTIGIANIGADLPMRALAPGFAEAFLQVAMGFLAGAVAVLAHWAVESRIDRQVLGV